MQKLKLNHLVIASCTTLALMSALTVTDAEARGKRGGNPNAAFERMDADANGVLTLEELTGPAETKAATKFELKDSDLDGFLTFEEMTAGREVVDYSDIVDDIAQCVQDTKDETGDESIVVPDPENYQTAQEKFDAADTSGDGLLDLAELQAKAVSKATEAFANMDVDESGDVTLEEFTSAKESRKATRRAIKACIDELTVEENF